MSARDRPCEDVRDDSLEDPWSSNPITVSKGIFYFLFFIVFIWNFRISLLIRVESPEFWQKTWETLIL